MGTGRGIADITPLTLLDFPNKVACIFWLRGCNLFCQYCYNVSLVRGTGSPAGDRTDYLDFLRDRVGFLDGVVRRRVHAVSRPYPHLPRDTAARLRD